jgi:hypothetical protein
MATYFRDTFTVGAAKLIEAHTTAEASGDVPDGIAWLWMAGAGDGTGKQLRVIPASDGYDSRLRFGSLVDGIAPALGSHMVVYPNLAIPVKNYKVHARHVHFQDPAATVSIMPVARLDPATGQRYAMVYLPQSNSAQVRRYTTPTSNSQPATATGIAVTPVTTSDCSLRVNEGQVTFAISVNGGAAQSVTYTDPSPLNNVINTFAGLQVYTESGNSGTPNTQLLQVLEFAVTDVDDPAPWTVVPTITLSSDTINPTFAEGGAAPSVPNISITTPIGVLNGLSIAKVGVAAWLTVGLTATTAPAQATFVIDPTGLVEGTYDAVVRITSTALGVTNSPQDIDVHLTVTAAPAPAIGVRDDDDNAVNIVTLSTETGGSLAPLEFNVINGGSVEADLIGLGVAMVGGDVPWLDVELDDDEAPTVLRLVPNVAGLAPGSYEVVVSVTSTVPNVTNSPRNVTVTATIGTAIPSRKHITLGALRASGKPFDYPQVSVVSQDEAVAKVVGDNEVVVVSPGTTTLIVTAKNPATGAQVVETRPITVLPKLNT